MVFMSGYPLSWNKYLLIERLIFANIIDFWRFERMRNPVRQPHIFLVRHSLGEEPACLQ